MIVTLTKEDAKRLLAINKYNRALDLDKVKQFTDDIDAGRWTLGGSTLQLENGIFKNGQHRLHAFVASAQHQITFYMEIL